jgi:hypothetical protein
MPSASSPAHSALLSALMTGGLARLGARKKALDPSLRYRETQFISVRCGITKGAASRSRARTCPFTIRLAKTKRRHGSSPCG